MKAAELARAIGGSPSRARGQILVVTVVALMAIVGGVAIVIDGGNAYAHQRMSQNSTDAAAEAGATVLAQYLSKNQTGYTDSSVNDAVVAAAHRGGLQTVSGYYTNWQGKPLDASGSIVTPDKAVRLGHSSDGKIPLSAQGVRVFGGLEFGTYFARALGINDFNADTVATAVAGRLTGGVFLPVVFPVNVSSCDQNGSLGSGLSEDQWHVSQPGDPPLGQKYVVPLCKTGSGNFMILDLDPNLTCAEEVTNPPAVLWNFSQPGGVWVPADNGNDCSKKIDDVMAAGKYQNTIVTVPICDNSDGQPCSQEGGGTNTLYHIVKVASFYVTDWSDSNNPNNSACNGNPPDLIAIGGNGSSACIVGYFVRYLSVGPIDGSPVGNSDAVGIQLIE